MSYRYRSSGASINLVWTIIGLNFIVFVATVLRPDLIFLLGIQRVTFDEKPWTLLSSMFVHAGLWHIVVNMFTFYFFSSFLISILGEGKFLLIYLGGGILGGIFFLLLANPFVTGVGASGAIFSMGGALTALRPRVPVTVFPIPVPMPLWVAIIGGFIIISFFPGIAWEAHLGGLVFGLAYGYFLRQRGHY